MADLKPSLWLMWGLSLVIFGGYSEAAENALIQPSNLHCACSNDQLLFTCTIVIQDRIGTTIWSGTAFTGCDGNRIQLRHSNLDATGQCNGGAIRASNTILEDCATSELTVMVDPSLTNKTICCMLNSNSGTPTIGEATISVVTGPYQQAPGSINLTDIRPGELTFTWSQIDPNCPDVDYNVTSDCGNCSVRADASATCYNLQLSTVERTCTFSVYSLICGFTGPSSNPVTVTLRVPDAPQVTLIPVYSGDPQVLINLFVQINQMMESFLISEGISSSIVSYIINSSSGTINTTAANCTGNVCKNMVEVRPPNVCQSSSGDNSITVSAVNRLGPGQPSQSVSVECTNRFVTVDINSAASTLTCLFQNSQNTVQKTCSVEYSLCNEEQVFTTEGNSTLELPNRVILQLNLPSDSDCYTYAIRASDGTRTVMIEERMNSSDEKSNSSATIAAAVIVPVIIIIAIVAVLVFIVLLIYFRRHASNALSGSPESPGKITLTAANVATDVPDSHRDADKDEKETKCVNEVQDSTSSGSVDQGELSDEKGLESSDHSVVPPENDLDSERNTDETNTNAGGRDISVKALCQDIDDDHDLY